MILINNGTVVGFESGNLGSLEPNNENRAAELQKHHNSLT